MSPVKRTSRRNGKKHKRQAKGDRIDSKKPGQVSKHRLSVDPISSSEIEMDDKPCEKQRSSVVYPPMNVVIQENNHGGLETGIKSELTVNSSLHDILTDPCIEFAVKTLTGEFPIKEDKKADDVFRSPFVSPLEESWMDPCMEFAVKTLTDEL